MPSWWTRRGLATVSNNRSSCSSESGSRGRKPPASQRVRGGDARLAVRLRWWYVSTRKVAGRASSSGSVSAGLAGRRARRACSRAAGTGRAG